MDANTLISRLSGCDPHGSGDDFNAVVSDMALAILKDELSPAEIKRIEKAMNEHLRAVRKANVECRKRLKAETSRSV